MQTNIRKSSRKKNPGVPAYKLEGLLSRRKRLQRNSILKTTRIEPLLTKAKHQEEAIVYKVELR